MGIFSSFICKLNLEENQFECSQNLCTNLALYVYMVQVRNNATVIEQCERDTKYEGE